MIFYRNIQIPLNNQIIVHPCIQTHRILDSNIKFHNSEINSYIPFDYFVFENSKKRTQPSKFMDIFNTSYTSSESGHVIQQTQTNPETNSNASQNNFVLKKFEKHIETTVFESSSLRVLSHTHTHPHRPLSPSTSSTL